MAYDTNNNFPPSQNFPLDSSNAAQLTRESCCCCCYVGCCILLTAVCCLHCRLCLLACMSMLSGTHHSQNKQIKTCQITLLSTSQKQVLTCLLTV